MPIKEEIIMSAQAYRPYDLFNVFDQASHPLFKSQTRQKAATEQSGWTPAVEIIEAKDHFLLSLDLPGVDLKAVSIETHENVLSIKGERQLREIPKGQSFKRNEKLTGHFDRQFTLPDDVNTDNIKAKASLGVLDISIPKKEKSQPRVISITES